MKAEDLAKELMKYPDFDVVFSFGDPDGSRWGFKIRIFQNLHIGDIGHSDKMILLDGKES